MTEGAGGQGFVSLHKPEHIKLAGTHTTTQAHTHLSMDEMAALWVKWWHSERLWWNEAGTSAAEAGTEPRSSALLWRAEGQRGETEVWMVAKQHAKGAERRRQTRRHTAAQRGRAAAEGKR